MKPWHEAIDMNYFSVNVFKHEFSSKNIVFHPHWHEELEILYLIKGSGLQQIDEKIFGISSGNIIIIQSCNVHSICLDSQNQSEILVLLFKKNLLVSSDHISADIIDSNDNTGKAVLKSILAIEKEYKDKNKAYEFFIKANIFNLAGLLTRYYCTNKNEENKKYQKDKSKIILNNTFKLVDKKYSEAISLSEAARASHLSVSHFTRLFKNNTGRTFKDYLMLYRINRAEELFASGLSITEIAYKSGFNSMTTFIRAFKKYRGCTPSEFRKSLA